HHAARRELSVIQAQYIGVTDAGYRDYVHGAVFLIGDFRNPGVAAQRGHDLRHGIAMPDDQYPAAPMFMYCPTRQPPGVIRRRDRLVEPQPCREGCGSQPAAQCRRYINGLDVAEILGVAEHPREQLCPRLSSLTERRID